METDMPLDKTNSTQLESSASSVSEQISESNDFDGLEENAANKSVTRTVSTTTMTEIPFNPIEEALKLTNPFHRELQEYFQ